MTRRLKMSGNQKEVFFTFNGQRMPGIDGEPVAAALLANGIKSIRTCEVTGEARGIYCGIGHCYECRAVIDGIQNIRTCLTPLKERMEIATDLLPIKGVDHQ